MISNTLEYFDKEKEETKINWTVIREFLKILLVLLIIFTIIFCTFFGCFLVWNDSTNRAAQTVTLSCEGAANEADSDSMGEYQLAKEVIKGFLSDYNWYRHKDREDRFIMFNRNGINVC